MSVSNLLTYNVSSIYRVNPQNSDSDNFQWQFNIDPFIWKDLTHVSVTEITIPYTYYLIQAGATTPGYNQFILYENSVAVGGGPLTIAEGNYSNIQLFSYFAGLLTFASTTMAGGHNITYTILENNTTFLGQFPYPNINKFYITSSNPAVQSSLFFYQNSNLDVIFGMKEGLNPFNVSGVLQSAFYNLNPENFIFFTSSCVQSLNNDNISNQTLCTISTKNFAPGQNISAQYEMIANQKIMYKSSTLFKFTLENDQQLSSFFLNDIPISFTIHFYTYTPYEKFLSKISDLLQLIAEEI